MSERGWFRSRTGLRLHALLNGRPMCGRESSYWRPGESEHPLCIDCEAKYGVAFPAPPGREHSSAHLPWFADYAAARSCGSAGEERG